MRSRDSPLGFENTSFITTSQFDYTQGDEGMGRADYYPDSRVNALFQGEFVQRNQILVPVYREYTLEKRNIQRILQQNKQQRAKDAYEELLAVKRTRDSYNLVKWDVCRKLVDQRREEGYHEKRIKKSMKFMIALGTCIRILRKNFNDFEEYTALKQKWIFQKMSVKRIIRAYWRHLMRGGCNLKERVINRYRTCATFQIN